MTTADSNRRVDLAVIGLFVVGMLARLAPHPPNVTPLAALALFGGACLPRRWAIVLPVLAVALSDVAIGVHQTMLFTWMGFALTGGCGLWLRSHLGAGRIVLASLAGSILFFLLTNAGVWWLGDGGRMYPQTISGLWQCYVAALPFFRNSLLGDLVYTAGFFGAYSLAVGRMRLATAGSSAPSA